MIFIDNKYTRWYYAIVNRAQARRHGEHTHHIIPESFYKCRTRKGPAGWIDGNPESANNKVNLTPKEHVICHLLLVKMTIGTAKAKMANAAKLMTTVKDNNGNKHKITSRTFVKLDELSREYQRENQNRLVNEGKHHLQNSEFAREREFKKVKNGTHPFANGISGKVSRERVKNGTHNLLKRADGTSVSSDAVAAGTHNFVGKNSPSQVKWTCPHCNISGKGKGNYTKNHGDNCKVVKPRPKRKPYATKSCPHCGIVCSPAMIGRFHGDKCKSIKIA